jgi:hypothetical protein
VPTACSCNNRQTSGCSRSRNAAVWKSSETFLPSASDNAEGPHSLLPPHRFPVCRNAVHRVLHNTRCHKLERHPSNTAWLAALAPSKPARLPRFVPQPQPSSARSEWPDPPRLGDRLCFFLANESVQFIQFCRSRLVWHGGRRQARSVGLDPIDYTLWINLQDPSNGVVAVTFYIHANGQQPCCWRIAIRFGLRCVDRLTLITTILLAAGWI